MYIALSCVSAVELRSVLSSNNKVDDLIWLVWPNVSETSGQNTVRSLTQSHWRPLHCWATLDNITCPHHLMRSKCKLLRSYTADPVITSNCRLAWLYQSTQSSATVLYWPKYQYIYAPEKQEGSLAQIVYSFMAVTVACECQEAGFTYRRWKELETREHRQGLTDREECMDTASGMERSSTHRADQKRLCISSFHCNFYEH